MFAAAPCAAYFRYDTQVFDMAAKRIYSRPEVFVGS